MCLFSTSLQLYFFKENIPISQHFVSLQPPAVSGCAPFELLRAAFLSFLSSERKQQCAKFHELTHQQKVSKFTTFPIIIAQN